MSKQRQQRPRAVAAQVVKQYRVMLVEEGTGAIVFRSPIVPDSIVSTVAAQLESMLPTLVNAARFVGLVRQFGGELADAATRGRRRG